MEEQLENDPFLQLLTDALRAGPGSPEWHQAVARVNAGETGPNDEYALLVQARENLASGKSYRAVRAGAGFTRKVLASIEQDSAATAAAKPQISASLISYLGAGLLVAAIGLIGFKVMESTGPVNNEDLTNAFFNRTIASANLDGPLPSSWHTIGPLQVDTAKGLTTKLTSPQKASNDYTGGGVVTTTGASPVNPFAVEATFVFQSVTDDVIPQLFMTDDPNFSPDRATSSHELVWLVRGGQAQVALPDGQLTGTPKKITNGQTVSVRIVAGGSDAVVICDGAILWSGNSQLSPDKPRYVGVRLLCKKADRQAVVVKELRELGK